MNPTVGVGGKRVGRGPGKSGPHIILRRDAEPIQAKSLIPCCQEKRRCELARCPYPKPTQVGG